MIQYHIFINRDYNNNDTLSFPSSFHSSTVTEIFSENLLIKKYETHKKIDVTGGMEWQKNYFAEIYPWQ
jgi:hypothetical protein